MPLLRRPAQVQRRKRQAGMHRLRQQLRAGSAGDDDSRGKRRRDHLRQRRQTLRHRRGGHAGLSLQELRRGADDGGYHHRRRMPLLRQPHDPARSHRGRREARKGDSLRRDEGAGAETVRGLLQGEKAAAQRLSEQSQPHFGDAPAVRSLLAFQLRRVCRHGVRRGKGVHGAKGRVGNHPHEALSCTPQRRHAL